MYIDCFQLTIAHLTAQWIVIRLKPRCKSFWFVLKQVFPPRVTGPKRDTRCEAFIEEETQALLKGNLQTPEVSILDSQITFMRHSNTDTLTGADI